MRLYRLLVVLLVEVFLLFLEVHFEDDAYEDDAADDADHSERVGASVAVGYDGHTSLEGVNLVDLLKGCIGSTEARSVGHGSAERADHHGQIVDGRNDATQAVVEDEHHGYVEHDDARRYAIGLQASLLERSEERGSHLQSDAEDEKNESEVLDEGDDFCVLLDVAPHEQVASQDADKENPCDTERDATYLDLVAQEYSKRDDQSVEYDCVGHSSAGRE